MSLMPVAAEEPAAMCASCGAALVTDQRYCLTCGQPCSPVRLAFLDVLQGERSAPQAGAAPPVWNSATGALEMSPLGYVPVAPGASGWLRRYSGLLSLLSVLVLCLLVGLLVGHWVTQSASKATGPQVYKIEGLGALAAAPAAAAASPAASTPSTAAQSAAAAKATAKEEAEESKEAAKETKAEKAPPPKPVKVTPSKLKKLSTTTGKQHAEEVNALGAAPIETGG